MIKLIKRTRAVNGTIMSIVLKGGFIEEVKCFKCLESHLTMNRKIYVKVWSKMNEEWKT